MENENRNLMLAMVLSVMVMLGWYQFFAPEDLKNPPVAAEQTAADVIDEPSAEVDVETALAGSKRVQIDTPSLGGSISLSGGYIDDLKLHNYKETLDPNSADVEVLFPKGTKDAYFTQTGFAAVDGTDAKTVPSLSDEWTVKSGDAVAPGAPLILTWTSSTGVVYEREFNVDEDYMFTITERVQNNTAETINIQPLAFVSHKGEPESNGTFVLHEGAIRNTDGVVDELKFKKIRSADLTDKPGVFADKTSVSEKGWVGFTTKYWMTAIVPENNTPFLSLLRYTEATDTYTAEAFFNVENIAAGATFEKSVRIFSGAKEVNIVREYEDSLGIDRFDDTVDWGWFYFLTKPIFTMLHWLYSLIGNMGLAIIALTFVIKTILFPLAYRSFVSMSRMKKLQPQMEKIKEAAGDDRMKLQQATMELYKKEKVNPVSGCLPIFLQIPIFFSLYKVLYVTTELRHAPFFGPWQDLSIGDPTSILNLFGLLPWSVPGMDSIFAIISLGILPIFLGISMWLTQKLNPTPTDPTQKMIFAWMPWVFMFMMGSFATGLVIYWITNNMLTFIQQYTIMRSQGVKPDIFGNILGRTKA